MWSRPKLKEEAKKVFTFSSENYWKMVLAGLIIIIVSGGLGGTISGFVGGFSGFLGGKNSNKHRHYEYQTVATVNDKSDYLKVTDEDGDISRVYVQGIDNTDELEDRIEKEIEKEMNEDLNGDYGTWNNNKAAAYGFMGMSIVMIVIVVLIVSIISLAIGFVFKAFLINPIILGCQSLFLNAYERPADLKDLGNGFKNQYIKNVGTLFLRDLFVFLWSLLFIIPGIIKLYEYRMMPYLIAENPSMTHQEAFKKSKEMMMGNKWDAFVLDLSFIGWFILNSLTCGILGLFYVNPYYFATDANLYRAIKMGGSTGFVSSNPALNQQPTTEQPTTEQPTTEQPMPEQPMPEQQIDNDSSDVKSDNAES